MMQVLCSYSDCNLSLCPLVSYEFLQGSGSPYNSPIGRGSPLLSPLAADPAGIKALNLDPSCPQVPDDVYRLVFPLVFLANLFL